MALGCGSYDVYLMRRGGGTMVSQLKFSAIEWNRVIDDVSTASVTMAGIKGKRGTWCCDDADLIHPWEHEIGIYRNGDRVWAGPVVSKASTDTGLSIQCRDLMSWMKRRRVRNNYNWVNQDLAVIFHAIVRDALIPDNSMGLVVSPTLCGVNGDRKILAAQYKLAWPELDELARTGVDWTVVDRTVVIGNFELDLSPIGTLTDGSFINLDGVGEDGADLVTDAITVGDGVGEAGATIVGRYTGGDTARYGVHELVYQESSIRDPGSAARNAGSRWDLNHEPAKIFNGGELDQNAEVTVAQLIAGRAVNVMIEDPICDAISGLRRISAVQGSVGPDHDRISVTIQALGTSGLAA